MKKMKRILLCLCVAAMLVSCMSALAFAEEDIGYVTYTLKGGDTVLNVCQSLGIDFYANQAWIAEVNGIGSFNSVKVGKVLYLPTFNTVKDPTRANNVKEELENAAKAAAANPAAANTAAAVPAAVGTTTQGDPIVSYLINHKLAQGETVGSVCAKYGIDFEANADKIKKLSGISNYYHVPVGKVVVIPSLTAPTEDEYTSIVAHTVKGGETTGSICGAYGLQFAKVEAQLKALNNTENLNRISVGQIFYLPIPGAVSAAPAQPAQGTQNASQPVAAQTYYHVTKQTSAHGSFVVQVGGKDATEIYPGASVNIVASPEAGYKVYTVVVTKAGTEQALPISNMNFTMPAFDVTVSVTFKAA